MIRWRTWWCGWCAFRDAIRLVGWTCYHCQYANVTPKILWGVAKFQLICADCSYLQPYPGHIDRFDPWPARPVRERLREVPDAAVHARY